MQTGSEERELVAGRYRLGDRLSSGGMGTIWRAEDQLLERTVAIKEVRIPGGLPAPEADRLRQRYLREARAAARLRHENVIVIYDVIPEDARVWIVMELFDAPDLAALVRADGPLGPPATARIGLQLLDALVAAHEAGVLHRDVKPANVLVCGNGKVVLTDFGVASVTGDSSLTATGQLIGSPAYLAPERLTGGVVGPASDLWALGCTLYVAVEGTSPFWREEPFAILSAITVEALPPPRLAGALAPVLHGLLEKDQGARWDAARARVALARVAAGEDVDETPAWGAPSSEEPAPSEPEQDAPDAEPEPAPRRRRRWVRAAVVAASIVGVLAVTAAAGLLYRPFGPAIGEITNQADADPSPPPEPVEFTHPTAAYSIVVPPGWGEARQDGTLWRFTQPNDGFLPGLTLATTVVPAPGNTSLGLARAEHTRLAADKAACPKYLKVRMEPIMYGEYRGTVHEYMCEGAGIHTADFRTVHQGKCYQISLTGPSANFDGGWEAFLSVARSLRLPE